jgi:hypothetical protein
MTSSITRKVEVVGVQLENKPKNESGDIGSFKNNTKKVAKLGNAAWKSQGQGIVVGWHWMT